MGSIDRNGADGEGGGEGGGHGGLGGDGSGYGGGGGENNAGGGGGGGGGSASYSPGASASYGDLSIQGGSGGDGGTGGGGGGGNAIFFSETGLSITVTNDIQLQGGDGGSAGGGGGGGAFFRGGDSDVQAGGDISITAGQTTVAIMGGKAVFETTGAVSAGNGITLTAANLVNGAYGTEASFSAASAVAQAVAVKAGDGSSGIGSAGAATFSVTGKLEATDSVKVASGTGNGGKAVLAVGTLAAPEIVLTKNGGALTAEIGTLDVSANNTAITLDGTIAADVVVDKVALGDGTTARTLTVSGTGGWAVGELAVKGAGNQLAGTALNLSNKTLSFDLTGISSGDTMVTSVSAVNIAGATVNMLDAQPALVLGQSMTLINNTSGAIAASSATATATGEQGATLTYALGGSGKLDAFLGKIQKTGNYTITGPYSATAGSSTGQEIEIDVSGTLTVIGDLTMTASAANSATVKAGTLVADSLTLDGANAKAAIGVYDVTTADSTLTLTGTTTADVVVDKVALGDGTTARTLTVNGTGWTVDELAVKGADNQLAGTALNLAGKTLSFDLTDISSGDAMVTSASAVDIAGATVNMLDAQPALVLGQSLTLIENTSGAIAASSATATATGEQDATLTYALGGSGKLDAFLGKIQKTGNYTITGPYSATAGSSTGQEIEIDVSGTLTVTGDLAMTASATNSATVKAGTLIADSLTLDGANATADIGVYDVTTADSVLRLTGTTAANVVIGTIDLGAGRKLTADGAGAYSATTLNVLGLDATYVGDLNADGMTLNFSLADPLAQGDTMLEVQGDADLTGATIVLEAVTKLTTLYATNDFTAVTATGSFAYDDFDDTQQLDAFGNKYDLALTGNAVVVTLVDQRSFGEIIENQFGGSGHGNKNMESGAAYLDKLARPGVIDTGFAKQLDNAFKNAIAPGGAAGARSLQQFIGGYAAYANQALSDDMARFRRRWQGRNRYFFDIGLLADAADGADAGVASGRALASPRYGARDNVARGQGRVWAGGFGSWAKQDERRNLPGYKYDSRGAVLGYEYSIGGLNLGFAGAYSRGDLEVDDLRYKNEADVVNLALYGAYRHESGFFVEGGVGYGHAWNDYKVNAIVAPGGTKRGKYGSDTVTADGEVGYIARLPRDFNLIPSVGVEYTYVRNGGWTEKINHADLIANRFGSGHEHGVDIPLGVRMNRVIRFGCDGGFVVPEARASYVYTADKRRAAIDAGFAGAPGAARMVGVDPGRSHWRVGGGVSGRVNSRVDFRVEYDFETRSGYKAHNVNGAVGVAF